MRLRSALCGAMTLVLALAGCDLLSPDQARVSFFGYFRPPLTFDLLEVTATDGRRTWSYTGADFQSSRENGTPHTSEVATATDGTLRVTFTVRDPTGRTPTTGVVELPLRPDWRMGVDFLADTTDPVQSCFGCQGSRAFPLPASLRTEAQDSLYVVWGGNSIKDPVIY